MSGSARLRVAVVLSTTEDACTVIADGHALDVPYAPAFPGPRVERVSPGHAVALADLDGGAAVVWRWYDAVIVGHDEPDVRLWEPAHGVVLARPRSPGRDQPLGTRAYASAGPPGAEWWVTGPSLTDLDLAEVEAFLTDVGVLD